MEGPQIVAEALAPAGGAACEVLKALYQIRARIEDLHIIEKRGRGVGSQ